MASLTPNVAVKLRGVVRYSQLDYIKSVDESSSLDHAKKYLTA